MRKSLTRGIINRLDPTGGRFSNQMNQSLSKDLSFYMFRQLKERLLSELWFKNGTLIYNQAIKKD